MTGYKSLDEYQQAFASSTKELMNDVSNAFTSYQVNIDNALEKTGLSVEEFNEKLINQRIIGMERLGKFLVFRFENFSMVF